MTYRIRTLAAVAATLSASLLVAPSARADIPSRVPGHCVTTGEAYSLSAKLEKGIRLTDRQLETQWDVRGKTDRGRSTHEKVVKVYPACLEHGISAGFVRVAFYRPTMRTLGAAYMRITFTVTLTPA